MKRKMSRLNWNGNAGRSEYGKLLPRDQHESDFRIDDYAKDGGPEVTWHLCSFYQDPLQ